MNETLTYRQFDLLVESHCEKVIQKLSSKEKEELLLDLLVESFHGNDLEGFRSYIKTAYGEEYYLDLIREVAI